MKNFLLVGLLIIYPLSLFSQSVISEKQEFIYKSVKGHDIKANIFLPASKEKHPVLVYFHGGGFIFGNRDRGLDNSLKEKLLADNYAVVSADYRLAPETKLDEILKDVRDVIKWLRINGSQRYNIDTSRIAVAGGSAGGYLALSSGFDTKNSPKVIISISGPTGFSSTNIQMGDLSILKQPGPFDIVKDSIVSYGDYDSRMELWRFLGRNKLALYEIFGFDPAQEPGKLDMFKLSGNIKSPYPPILLVQARNDRMVDVTQVEDFYKYLESQNVVAELYLVENGHNSELINQNPQAVDKIIQFLDSYFKKVEPLN